MTEAVFLTAKKTNFSYGEASALVAVMKHPPNIAHTPMVINDCMRQHNDD